jgi:hypothetical protein
MTNISEPQDVNEEFPTREQIESRAHEIYLKRCENGQDGHASEDWLTAEEQLKREHASDAALPLKSKSAAVGKRARTRPCVNDLLLQRSAVSERKSRL